MAKRNDNQYDMGRRAWLRGLLGTAGTAAIATGLPPGFLRAPLARAELTPAGERQFLILASSDRGDPLNANCPGTYDHPEITHPADPGFAATAINLGGTATTAAQLWSTLPQWVLDRSCFVHHSTRSAVHSEMPKILRLMGASQRNEMLPSLIAADQAEAMGTIQAQPVNVGKNVNLTAGGVALPRIQPTALKQLLTASTGPLADLRGIRDRHVDEIHAILKRDGTTEQRRYLDARAQSREDARKLADDANAIFDGVVDDSAAGELLAAIALFRLGVTPVVSVSIPFGGDNHSDVDLQEETDQHGDGIEAIATAMNALETHGMRDEVTLAILNVFGRNLVGDPAGGRDHWSQHAVSLLVGSRVRPGVIGGLEPADGDFRCTGIDSGSGMSVPGGGDVPYEQTLAATGKTIWAAVGADCATIDTEIGQGRVLTAALQ